ncbi:DUF2157 domain-containing protein [Laspinema olomoucense]|uniref:DUF2157 domain-containing protein n=1 Tax=Laspinema olomoucense D3b TaxID=2953688 RepID=A0ABT2NAA5_9CYAN|nr:DUF2157 domain-containing protein [Laspinema sp. D3b]MCT7979396.1 DUF2157 domain-containing protein [Laspinema sp. D3b]
MVSEKFRRQLRTEARSWTMEGLISQEQYQELSNRYLFETLDRPNQNQFIALLLGLGALLISGGAIALVQANWEVWSRESKTAVLVGIFIAVNLCAFYLWGDPLGRSHRFPRWQTRTGHGLFFLSSLLLGLNMSLIGEIFLMKPSLGEFWLIWGLAVLVMAYSLRLTGCGILATLLIGGGYWPGLAQVYQGDGFFWIRTVVLHLPLISAFLLVPLAYWCRSPWIFGLATLVLIQSVQVNLIVGFSLLNVPNHWMLAIAYALPPALLWSYDDQPWQVPSLFQGGEDLPHFRPISRTLALIFLALSFYVISFHWFWSSTSPLAPWDPTLAEIPLEQGFAYLLDVLIVLGSWLALVWHFSSSGDNFRRFLSPDAYLNHAIALVIAIATGMLFWHFGIQPLPLLGPLIFNILLFLLAYGLMRRGLTQSDRRIFWAGTLLLTLQILTRVLEYETGLVLKSIVFVLCGMATIAIGLTVGSRIKPLENEDLTL